MEEFLNERFQKVLHCIIEEYIVTANPVGSKFIAGNCSLNLSSASIRNIMVSLEEKGYIRQPYFSAGRVPTSLGYKFYINGILKTKKISKQQQEEIKSGFNISGKDIKKILWQALHLLSEISHYMPIVLAPERTYANLLHIEFIKLDKSNLLVVMVFDGGVVENKIISVDRDYSQSELGKYSMKLNEIINGHNIDELKDVILQGINEDRKSFFSLLNGIIFNFDLVKNTIENENEDDYLYIGSRMNLFDEPEFSNYEKIKSLVKAFEDKKTIIKLLELAKQKEGIHIFIGSDTEWSDINGLSVITASYHSKKGLAEGSIGLIGPSRMNYAMAIPAVTYMAKLLCDII
jgi:heat-inducible transcriptional repressor